jgi:acetyl-CoA acetyltransferase
MVHATDLHGLAQRRTPPERFAATRQAARQLWTSVPQPAEVDVAEVHDAFTVLEAINLEDLGLAPDGQGAEDPLEADPATAEPPVVNPGGGLEARGHPVGATGLAQAAACFDQPRERAPNPVPGAGVARAQNIGGFGNNVHVALFEEASA